MNFWTSVQVLNPETFFCIYVDEVFIGIMLSEIFTLHPFIECLRTNLSKMRLRREWIT